MRSHPCWAAVAVLLATACSTRDEPVVREPAVRESGSPAVDVVDFMPIAERVVTQSLGVEAGNHVLITGTPESLELMEDLAVQVRQEGAWPLISVRSDRLTRLTYDSVDEARDADVPSLALAVARTFPLVIAVEGAGSWSNLNHVSPARFVARGNAAQPINTQISRMPRKILAIGNGMFPSEDNARAQGMALADLSRMFWAGVNVDPQVMGKAGSAVQAVLRSGRLVHVTEPGGTDVTFTLASGKAYFSDGLMRADDARGQGEVLDWLPAGEAYKRVVPGSASGTIVADRVAWEDAVIENLRITVENGRITAMTAPAGIDRLKGYYDLSSDGKDALSVLDIGVNTSMSLPAGSKLRAVVPAGMVTLGFGNDVWAGGSNDAPFFAVTLAHATVTVDETPLVEGGTLRVEKAGR